MEFRQLQYFVAVAEALHFGRAATRLGITQPALSKQIQNLEELLGVTLLFRTKRTVQLTHAGKTFLAQTYDLLRQKESAIQLTQRTGRGEIGQLSIGFTQTAAQTMLPPLLNKFFTRYPMVDIALKELATEAQVSGLNQNTLDLAFLHPPIDQRGLSLHPILKETFVAVLPHTHPLGQCDAIPIAAFANEPLIVHPRQEGPILYDGFLQVCQMAGFRPHIAKESLSMQTRLCLVAAGVGITFISDRLQSLVGDNVLCRPIENCPVQLEFGAAWREKSNNPILNNILEILFNEIDTDYATE